MESSFLSTCADIDIEYYNELLLSSCNKASIGWFTEGCCSDLWSVAVMVDLSVSTQVKFTRYGQGKLKLKHHCKGASTAHKHYHFRHWPNFTQTKLNWRHYDVCPGKVFSLTHNTTSGRFPNDCGTFCWSSDRTVYTVTPSSARVHSGQRSRPHGCIFENCRFFGFCIKMVTVRKSICFSSLSTFKQQCCSTKVMYYFNVML